MSTSLYKFKSIFLFVLTFTLGYSLFFSYFEESFTDRDPAALGHKIYQLKNLDPDQLKQELSQKVLIQQLPDGKKYIRFASLSAQVCKQYSKIQIQFMADGVLVSGEAPTMTIDADCKPSQDPLEMASIEIPIDRFLKEKPKDAIYEFTDSSSVFTFKNFADEWPKTWLLQSIVFKNEKGNEKIVAFDQMVKQDSQALGPSQQISPKVLEF